MSTTLRLTSKDDGAGHINLLADGKRIGLVLTSDLDGRQRGVAYARRLIAAFNLSMILGIPTDRLEAVERAVQKGSK